MPPRAKRAGERDVLYPKLLVNGIEIPPDSLKVTTSRMKKLLGWETLAEYRTRVKNPSAKFDKGKHFVITDINGDEVCCQLNNCNRPFHEDHARRLAQDILEWNWAGPTTMPGETVNGETIIIGRTGEGESIQHRGIGLIFAQQLRDKHPEKYPKWNGYTELFIETLIVQGVSESPRVLQTLDNVRPRTLADTLFTSEMFRALPRAERLEMSRMTDAAVDFLWRRTAVKPGSKDEKHYQTHSASQDFLKAHGKLRQCVEHLFKLNEDRALSLLRLSPGQCAAMMYMMGAANSQPSKYYAPEPVGDKGCDWTLWGKAEMFWKTLAYSVNRIGAELKPVQDALGRLVDPQGETTGRSIEKTAVIARAWAAYRKNGSCKFEDAWLDSRFFMKEEGITIPRWDHWPSFGGIDLGEPASRNAEPTVTPEMVEEEKRRIRKEAAQQLAARITPKGAGKAQ